MSQKTQHNRHIISFCWVAQQFGKRHASLTVYTQSSTFEDCKQPETTSTNTFKISDTCCTLSTLPRMHRKWISIISDGGCFSFHFCMDVIRFWSLIRKPLIKLQSTVLSRTEGWRLELYRRQHKCIIYNIPQVMLYNSAVTLAQIRAQGHLSACGTIVTPVATFAATFPSFLCWMTQ